MRVDSCCQTETPPFGYLQRSVAGSCIPVTLTTSIREITSRSVVMPLWSRWDVLRTPYRPWPRVAYSGRRWNRVSNHAKHVTLHAHRANSYKEPQGSSVKYF